MPAAWKLRSIMLNHSSGSVGVNSGIRKPIRLISSPCRVILGVCSITGGVLDGVVSMFCGVLVGECSTGIFRTCVVVVSADVEGHQFVGKEGVQKCRIDVEAWLTG